MTAIERDYNITQVKQRRRIHVFEVPDIENVLEIAKNIYENEDVKYGALQGIAGSGALGHIDAPELSEEES